MELKLYCVLLAIALVVLIPSAGQACQHAISKGRFMNQPEEETQSTAKAVVLVLVTAIAALACALLGIAGASA